MRCRCSPFFKGLQRDVLIRYVRFEILRAQGLKFMAACQDARISAVTVRGWRKRLGMKTRGRGGKFVVNEIPLPIRISRYTKLAA